MIKLQDFARECGVTDRQIQRLLKKYEEDLSGHFERKGPNGTWLDEDACQILRSRMRQLPPAVIDGETFRENDDLKKRISELEKQLHEKEALVAMAQQQVQAAQGQVAQLQEKAGRVVALEEGKKLLEESRDEYKAQAEKSAQKASEEAQRAEQAVREAQELRSRLEAAEASEQRFRSMGLFEFLRERKKGRQVQDLR